MATLSTDDAPAAAAVKKPRMEVVLHSYWRSSSSYRVRIALNLKGISYTYHGVHLVKDGGQQLTAEHAALNPMKSVPVLHIDGFPLLQSVAICEYLEETRPSPALLPTDAAARATVRALVNIIACDVQPLGNLKVLKHVATFVDKAAADATKAEWARRYIKDGFDAIEATLARTAGTYCVGDSVTLADVFLVPQVYNALRFGLDMAPYPTIQRVHATLSELPAFKAAHPSVQPDADA